ncbi:MAG: hypothetical protein ABEH77_10130 [Halobacteriaceae archaeon]
MDEDTLLTLAGAGLVAFLAVGVGVGALAAVTADERGGNVPEAEWELERVNGSHVRITHAGGDPVPADDLVVRVEGYPRETGWSGVVEEGDATTVEASEGQTVKLKWTGGGRVEDTLASWRV